MRLKEGIKIESHNCLQVVYCKFFAGVLQVVYRLFAGSLQLGTISFSFPVILCRFHKEMHGRI